MKVYSIPCHVRGHINVMLVVQSCTDSLRVMPCSSSESSSDCTYDISNVTIDEDLDMQEGKEVNVKTKEEECIDIKHEDGILREEEKEEEEDIDTKEGKDIDVKEEVSYEDSLYRFKDNG